MGSSARHQEDYNDPKKVAEMKSNNLKDYQRWKREEESIKAAIEDVQKCIVLQYKSVTLRALEDYLYEKQKFMLIQLSAWAINGVYPDELKS